MKNSNTIIILIIILIFGGLFLWGYKNRQSSSATVQGVRSGDGKTALVATENVYDFGSISMKNGNVRKDFEVKNPTDKDILVPRVITSCMCTEAYIVGADGTIKGPYGMPGHGGNVPPANETIKAGETKIIRVIYNPNAHGPAGVGTIDRFVILTDQNGDDLQLEVKAVVTP